MTDTKQLITGICLASLFSATMLASTAAIARPNDQGMTKAPILKQLRQLDLSDEQKATIKQIMRTAKQDKQVYRSEMDAVNDSFQRIKNMPSWDQALVESIVQQKQSKLAPIQGINAKTRHAIFHVLSAAQQQQLNEQAPRANRKRKGHRPLLKQIKQLDLSEQQRSAIEQLKQQASTSRASEQERRQAYRENMQAIIQATQFDENAWQNLQENMQSQSAASQVARLKHMYELWQILTPAQQKALERRIKRPKFS